MNLRPFFPLLFALILIGCDREPEPQEYVAQVGDAILTNEDLQEMMGAAAPGIDSSFARSQLVEQWVVTELLHQEAMESGLSSDPEVQRQLDASRRSVLVSALLGEIYGNASDEPTPAEIESYYERHREQLTLREAYVRIRHAAFASRDAAGEVRSALLQAIRRGEADSTWHELIGTHDAALHGEAMDSYLPKAQALRSYPEVRARLDRMGTSELAPVLDGDSLFHVLQLVDEVPAGSTPRLDWVRDQLRQRLRVQRRKQIYARHVERLRNEARARGLLDVRLSQEG